jgi:AraC family transcriptional regulator
MNEPRQAAIQARGRLGFPGPARRRTPGFGLGVELRATQAGVIRQPALSDHHISVHAGPPVRVSCHSGRVRSVRTRGEIYLTPAGTSDEWLEDDAGESVDLHLPTSLLRLAADEMGLDADRVDLEPRFHFKDPQIEHIAWALEAERRSAFPTGALYSDSLGLALAHHLLSRYRAIRPVQGALSQRQLREVTDHIEQHLDQRLSLVRLARVAGLSPSHFKTLFKRSLGLPVHEYVVRRRVERAKALLQRAELPASQVALEAGFAHQSHMARWMRRLLGVTPTAVKPSRR